MITPELSTNCAYVKVRRHHDGDRLWLYKFDANVNTESRIEVMCSVLLDKMNIRHCHYEAGKDDDKYVFMCPAMTDDNISILPSMYFYTYCNVNNIDFDKKILEIDAIRYKQIDLILGGFLLCLH